MRASAWRWPHPVFISILVCLAVGCATPAPRPRLVGAPPIPAAGVVVDLTPSWPRSNAHEGDFDRAGCHVVVSPTTTVSAIAATRWIGPTIVIEASSDGEPTLRTVVDVDALERFEAEHGRIHADDRVLLRTGFPSQARGLLDQAAAFVDPPLCPGFSSEAVRWLVSERGVRMIGSDAPRLIANRDDDPIGMRVLADVSGIAILNLTDVERLPARGATLVVAPIPRRDTARAAARVLAVIPR